VWVVAAVAVPRALPLLSSVTQGNNANFSRPALERACLEAGGAAGRVTLTPVPVVARVPPGALTRGGPAWLQKLQQTWATWHGRTGS